MCRAQFFVFCAYMGCSFLVCKALTGRKMGVPASILDFLLLCMGLRWLFNMDRREGRAATRPKRVAHHVFSVLG